MTKPKRDEGFPGDAGKKAEAADRMFRDRRATKADLAAIHAARARIRKRNSELEAYLSALETDEKLPLFPDEPT
jgi:hypothetical protein